MAKPYDYGCCCCFEGLRLVSFCGGLQLKACTSVSVVLVLASQLFNVGELAI